MSLRAEGVVNTLGATNVAKSVREDLDFYQTPSGATQALIDMDLLRKGLKIWEPMSGNGAIAEVLKQNSYDVFSSDIVERKYKLDYVGDFFSFPSFPDVMNLELAKMGKPIPDNLNSWQIVTNPPYNMADKFLLHCLSMRPSFLAVFLPVRYLEGIKRYKEIYSKYTPSDVIVFARRYGCYKESDVEAGVVSDHGIGSAVAYMWLCFTKRMDGTYGNETKLHFVY